MSEIILNPGFRFSPTDRELIEWYLRPKIMGQNLPCNIIQERQVFGPNANPWQLFDPNNDSWLLSEKSEKVIYVFTHLTKKAASLTEKKKRLNNKGLPVRQNYNKTAGCGTWSGKTRRTKIKDGKRRVIGETRYLVFQINQITADLDLNKVGGHYSMDEYSLFGVEAEIVLCRITLDQSKAPVFKLPKPESTITEKITKAKNNPKKTNQSIKAENIQKKITKPKKNPKTTNLVKTRSLLSILNSETSVSPGSAQEGVYGSDIAGQNDFVETVNSASDNNLSGVEGTSDQGLPEEYIGAITTKTRDLIVYHEREGVYESVVEDDYGSQLMVNNFYQEDDIEAIWNTLPTPNLDDMMVNDTVVAGYFEETNETHWDSTLYGLGEDGLYMSEVLNTMSEVPSTSFDPLIDPHEVDSYFDVEALLKDLNSRGEESAVYENRRTKLLAKRKLVAEIPEQAKRLCL